jgi:hypothetical protein
MTNTQQSNPIKIEIKQSDKPGIGFMTFKVDKNSCPDRLILGIKVIQR